MACPRHSGCLRTGNRSAGSAAAEDVRVERMKTAFQVFVAKNKVKNASLVVLLDGEVAGTVNVGKYTTSGAVPIASLSKAITGVCIARLVDSGKLGFDAEIETLLSGYFCKHPPKDSRVRKITVAQLLTHTSGITDDPSQSMTKRFRPFSKTSENLLVTVALSRPLGREPGSGYVYNNMNYAVLGLIVETVTGEAYEKYCGREVLEAVGVQDATLDPDWRILGAFAGWKISAEGYAKFLSYFDPSKGLLKTQPADWPKAPDLRGGWSYSLGVFMHESAFGPQYNFTHPGRWEGPNASFGAYFALWDGTIGAIANYAPTVPDATATDLNNDMFRAAHP